MEPDQFLGLVKFFRNEAFLDSLIDGRFHCTPPEVYRLDKQEGVSDRCESCAYSFRQERGERCSTQIKIGDDIYKLENEVFSITALNHNQHNSWMHCWFSLRMPKDHEALEQLKRDIKKMKTQFGSDYAFLPAANLTTLIQSLQELSSKPMYYGEVEYSSDKSKWGNLCKASEYSYQREYRFLFGKCSSDETDFYVFNNHNTFRKLIFKNAHFEIQSLDDNITWFDLRV